MGADDTTASDTENRTAASFAFPRHEQTFPALTPHEIARMRRFGEVRLSQYTSSSA
jgi:thioredoxin reductase (NADPH)